MARTPGKKDLSLERSGEKRATGHHKFVGEAAPEQEAAKKRTRDAVAKSGEQRSRSAAAKRDVGQALRTLEGQPEPGQAAVLVRRAAEAAGEKARATLPAPVLDAAKGVAGKARAAVESLPQPPPRVRELLGLLWERSKVWANELARTALRATVGRLRHA